MAEYIVTVLASGKCRVESSAAPQSFYERSCVEECAKHTADQGYGLIRVTVRDDGSITYVPMCG